MASPFGSTAFVTWRTGESVEADGAAQENRPLVADELAATAGEDGGRLVKHARYYWLLLAEGHLTPGVRGDFAEDLGAAPADRIERGGGKETDGRKEVGTERCLRNRLS